MKYRSLSTKELEPLKDDFIKFLSANTITGEDWINIKSNKPNEASTLVEVFSDIVWEKSLEKIKSLEKNSYQDSNNFFEDVPLSLPALSHALKVQKKASQFKFDWTNSEEILGKINEEVRELWHALESNEKNAVEEEFGDLLFSLVNLARKLDIDPENSLEVSINKFKKRVGESIKIIRAENMTNEQLTDEKLFEIWEQVKELLKKNDA